MPLENKKLILQVFIAIGTVGAVLLALFRDFIREIIRKPKLDVKFYEASSPYLRDVPPPKADQLHQHVLTLYILNKGKSVAESCQPLITRLWIKDEEEWIAPKGWVQLPLDWVFVSRSKKEDLFEIDIVPYRYYPFNICSFFENHTLKLTAPIKSRSQPIIFNRHTTYCIEVTVFSVNAKSITKWIYIEWKGVFSKDLSMFENNIKVYESKDPPTTSREEIIKDADFLTKSQLLGMR